MILLNSNLNLLYGDKLKSEAQYWNETNEFLVSDVILFCKSNGRKMLTFISIGDKDGYNITIDEKRISTYVVPQILNSQYNSSYSRFFSSFLEAKQEIKVRLASDTFVFLLPLPALSDNTLSTDIFEFISQNKVKSCIVMVLEQNYPFQDVENDIVSPILRNLKLSLFFYLVRSGTQNISAKSVWKQVITLKNNPQVVIDDIKFDTNLMIKEYYNLNGLNIQNLLLSWSPYSTIDGCNLEGRDCKTETGIVPDLVHSLSERFNFTWTSTKETTGKWGVLPQDGTPFDLEKGKWSGVMGGVVKGDYHTSLAGWTWNLQRENVLDLVMFQKEWTVLAVSPKPPKVDPMLFIRPFRYDAWHFILGMTCLLIIFILLPYAWLRRPFSWEDTQGFMISTTTAWIFFFLLNAFYGGAMTMFFASEVSLPFETVREAMQSYPGA